MYLLQSLAFAIGLNCSFGRSDLPCVLPLTITPPMSSYGRYDEAEYMFKWGPKQ